MGQTITLTSNHGLGWSIGDEGSRDIQFKTTHGLGWTWSEHDTPDTAVTNDGEPVTNAGEFVTNGAH